MKLSAFLAFSIATAFAGVRTEGTRNVFLRNGAAGLQSRISSACLQDAQSLRFVWRGWGRGKLAESRSVKGESGETRAVAQGGGERAMQSLFVENWASPTGLSSPQLTGELLQCYNNTWHIL